MLKLMPAVMTSASSFCRVYISLIHFHSAKSCSYLQKIIQTIKNWQFILFESGKRIEKLCSVKWHFPYKNSCQASYQGASIHDLPITFLSSGLLMAQCTLFTLGLALNGSLG